MSRDLASRFRPGGEASWLPIIRTLTSFGFAQAIVVLVGLAIDVGLLVWLFERHHNEHFGGGVKRGLTTGVWWSAVAMTQRYAGDLAPRTHTRAYRRNHLDDRLDRGHCGLHGQRHVGADDKTSSGDGTRGGRSVERACRSGCRNFDRGDVVPITDRLSKICDARGRHQGHCARIRSTHLSMTSRCLPGLSGKIFHLRSS